MKKTLFTTALFALPLVAAAQNITTALLRINDIVNILIPLMIALALVAFFWGLVKYIWSSGEGHEQGKNVMIAGLVALFLMVSVFGIIRLVGDTFGVNGGGTFTAPHVDIRR
ncbi:hypothetical protein KW798_01190 [Candidatus Parcubacteria bacterium]|nr:hypothetical protein [Candidatus Parcubacteria bacterium]